jgi:caffeoyl-CoA O-methyltransferase
MKNKEACSRREFLGQAGGAAGLLALGTLGSPVNTAAAGEAHKPAAADAARIRKVLDSMEPNIGRYWSTPRKDAEYLSVMVKATRATQVLEVGTSQGYSAIWMALGLEETGGRLTTIEIDPARHDVARRNVNDAGLADRITLIRGDAHREIPRLKGPFDFVFLDADKDGMVDYFRKLYPARLAPGAMLAVHNAVTEAGDMRQYTEMLRKHPEFDTVLVSATMDDGICLSYRHRRGGQAR